MKTEHDLNLEKKIIRKKIQEDRNHLSPSEHAAKSQLIAEKLTNFDDYLKAKTIFIFYPFRSEVDTTIIIKDALTKGKNCLLYTSPSPRD